MQNIRIEKLTINIGAGKEQANLNRSVSIIKELTGLNPVKTKTRKRIATWGLRPGLPIGCKITLRKKQIPEVLKNLLTAKDNILLLSSFDDLGNISFGIKEHIDIPGIKYDPKIGVMGLQACITLERPGFRVKKRKLFVSKLGKKHKISKNEAIDFMKKNYNIKIKEEIDKEELGE